MTDQSEPVQCPTCDRWVLNPTDMDAHLATHHEPNETTEMVTLTTAGMEFLRYLVTEFEHTNGSDADANLHKVKTALFPDHA